jgi:hypothetical protein
VGRPDLWVDLAYMLGMLPLRAWLYSGHHGRFDEGVVVMCARGGVAIMVPLHLVLLVASGSGQVGLGLPGWCVLCVMHVSLLGARPQCF